MQSVGDPIRSQASKRTGTIRSEGYHGDWERTSRAFRYKPAERPRPSAALQSLLAGKFRECLYGLNSSTTSSSRPATQIWYLVFFVFFVFSFPIFPILLVRLVRAVFHRLPGNPILRKNHLQIDTLLTRHTSHLLQSCSHLLRSSSRDCDDMLDIRHEPLPMIG